MTVDILVSGTHYMEDNSQLYSQRNPDTYSIGYMEVTWTSLM